MKATIGGNRLGSGGKNSVELHGFQRSTHDQGYTWRSSMSTGTLVPFLTEVGLPGTTFDIDLQCEILTLPTIGPLFGSMKVQLDIFECPIRLYNAELHMNKLGIGLDMSQILLPRLDVRGKDLDFTKNLDIQQIEPSTILAHLNMNGLGKAQDHGDDIYRQFNAVPYLAYWDIYKNYYANKQEEIGYVIHSDLADLTTTVDTVVLSQMTVGNVTIPATAGGALIARFKSITLLTFTFNAPYEEFDIDRLKLYWDEDGGTKSGSPLTWFKDYAWNPVDLTLTFSNPVYPNLIIVFRNYSFDPLFDITDNDEPKLSAFPLSNIDEMRTAILQNPTGVPFIIDYTKDLPYGGALLVRENEEGDILITSAECKQEGLGVKTYQSDLFNNWMNTEWIDGNNGVNAVTKMDVVDDGITINEMLLKKKIFDMLNRIAISGGSYDDWLDAVYTHERRKSIENPMYSGGLSKELVFQSVISNSASEDQPLGTLGGRGTLNGKHKGGKITIKCDEPCYIMGIISITPRVDYSQGNKWDTNLYTMDDFHKPSLDAIGYQNLITDQMASWDTVISHYGVPTFKSAGKQPAWINYQTNVNVVRGNFAIETDSMFMVLNRRYEVGIGAVSASVQIKDLTTYVDPKKYNFIFAETRRDAQNFWAQIKVDMITRRKMSARQIPNL